MKKGLVVCMCFGLLLLFASPAFSQDTLQTQKSTESFMIDNFNSEGENGWTWDVSASRYVADGYPKKGYFDGIPNSLKYLLKDGKDNQKVLGVQIAFKRKGDNWFEVYPVKDGKAYEVPFVGSVTQIDFWVWGAHYMYFLDVIVRDADGRVHVLPAGNLAFDGWRNIVVSVPGWIRQHSRSSSGRIICISSRRLACTPKKMAVKSSLSALAKYSFSRIFLATSALGSWLSAA